MKTSHILKILFAGIALGSLCSCGFKKEKITASPPIKVTVLPVSTTSAASGRVYSGTVASDEGSELSFAMPGTVKEIYVKEGDKVTKGQLLAELKNGTLQNNYNIAQATLDDAQDAYNRFKQLHDANALADIRWVEVQNALKQAQNAAEMARRALDDAKIYAPVNGTISEKLIDVGQTVVPAVPAIRMITLGDVKVTIPVPESEIANLTIGEHADITVEALNDLQLSGKLSDKSIVANPLTRTYEAKFAVDNSAGKLLPGMICSVALQSDSTQRNVIVLPPQSVLLSADNRNFVWVAAQGEAHQRFVEAPDMTTEGIVISSGLSVGDTVIIAGMQKVSDGTPIDPQL